MLIHLMLINTPRSVLLSLFPQTWDQKFGGIVIWLYLHNEAEIELGFKCRKLGSQSGESISICSREMQFIGYTPTSHAISQSLAQFMALSPLPVTLITLFERPK